MSKVMNLQEIVETIEKCSPVIKARSGTYWDLHDIWNEMEDCLFGIEGAKCLGEIKTIEKTYTNSHSYYVIYYFPAHNIYVKRNGFRRFYYYTVEFSDFEPVQVFPVERFVTVFEDKAEIEFNESRKENRFSLEV